MQRRAAPASFELFVSLLNHHCLAYYDWTALPLLKAEKPTERYPDAGIRAVCIALEARNRPICSDNSFRISQKIHAGS